LLQNVFGHSERIRMDWRNGFAQFAAPANRTAERIVATNIRDFASFPILEGRPDEWLALQAGMPLYPALFGRDTLTAGWQAAWVERLAAIDLTATGGSTITSVSRLPWIRRSGQSPPSPRTLDIASPQGSSVTRTCR
jgi:hypothetical protein